MKNKDSDSDKSATTMPLPETLNQDYIESQYIQWKQNPESVARDWDFFFKGFEFAESGKFTATASGESDQASCQGLAEALIARYRNLGHLLACMDPLTACPTDHPLLSLESFDLEAKDLESEFFTRGITDTEKAPLKEIIRTLKATYCRSIGVEYMHIQDPDERRWLQERMEPVENSPQFDAETKITILKKLSEAVLFEKFLNKKYVGVTRFSLEGGEALIPLLHFLIEHVAEQGCREIILGMAHRGRLNVLINILKKPYEEIFGEFESCYDPDQLFGAGDVKYHNGYLADIETHDGSPFRLYMLNNPSHLEAVDPVAEGAARARQDIDAKKRYKVLPLLIHGDAAFAGEGVVAETLNLSQLEGYATAGTVHIIINNQIGYTTLPEDARSTRYSTDIAKMLMAPIFHVQGENPEAAVHVARLAAEYRKKFSKDVIIDLVSFRRYGHNESDEPYFTQPLMYDRIKLRPSLHRLYGDQLIAEEIFDKQKRAELENQINRTIDEAYQEVHGSACPFPEDLFFENWDEFHGVYSHEPVETGVAKERLTELTRRLCELPQDFTLHPKLKRLLTKRLKAVETGSGIDWANAEALAFASLIDEGTPIRLSGQDSGRGTFSQRHCVLTDIKTEERYVPLNALGNASFDVCNSPLSEFGVLGFEYGYSMIRPEILTLWEAQFGDFVNCAQPIIDLFITSGQSKWQRLSGLVMLLPHGWEGLGPEHSSARLERFLQLCADNNMLVCNPTTPAQYFHLLRRQIKARFRKPLVVMTPKSLLRLPLAVSDLDAMANGAFEEVIDDQNGRHQATTVLICSGKIYYQLLQRHQAVGASDIAIIRLEQFYPFPKARLSTLLNQYKQAQKWVWVQEEPENMGAWQFVRPRLEKIIGQPLGYIGRKPASSPATGFPAIYRQEQEAISLQAIIDKQIIKKSS
ncbi:2-oxoglutarate dehydrogenase E1 component [Desulfococcaceae bacterium HSG7]|nr:2-oxoglutarate dehydrogenase E1 component [Desulfococcaceae bacterium HSG7]